MRRLAVSCPKRRCSTWLDVFRSFNTSDHSYEYDFEAKYSRRSRAKRAALLYEDDAIIAVDKPAGIPTQGGRGVSVSMDSMFPGYKLVHRLDKNVSGVLVMAKTSPAAKKLGEYFSDAFCEDSATGTRGGTKVYWAMVCANAPIETNSVIKIPLKGKKALTKASLLEEHGTLAWMELQPETGRMHQLRIHCAEGLGAAILGDSKYGKTRDVIQKEVLGRVREKLSMMVHENHRVTVSQRQFWPPVFLHCRELRVPFIDAKAVDRNRFVKLTSPPPIHFRALWDLYGFHSHM